jgi:hypothetical protein
MVKSIKIDYISHQNVLLKKHFDKKISFSGSANLSNTVKDELLKQSKSLKLFSYVSTNKGEILNNVVNAVGTGFVAPFFIAFNPLSKEDDNTKKYSALRQPVSAIIAVAMQVGITLKIDKLINHIASLGKKEGLGKKFDLSIEPDKNYLYSIIKKEKPTLSKEQIWNEVKKKQQEIKKDVIAKIASKLKLNGMSDEKAAMMATKKFDSKLINVKNRLGAYKAAIAIAVSLVTMPLACTALNWSYPRIVEKLFPSLCKDCVSKGGKK